MAFNHENLNVYRRMLSFNAEVAVWTGGWDSKHAICDHLTRAAESMLENVAIKLAARLDLCVIQNLLPQDEVIVWKALLQRVSVMTSSMIAGIQR
jgi:hypothetical protein